MLEIRILLCLSHCNSYAGVQASFNAWPGPGFVVFFPPLCHRTGPEMPKQTFHILPGALVALHTKPRMLQPLGRFAWFLGTRKRGAGIGCAQMQITHGLGMLAASQGCPVPGTAAWYPCAKCRRICARQRPPSSGAFFGEDRWNFITLCSQPLGFFRVRG